MMPLVYCPHCGTANRAGSRFCNRCGTELAADAAAVEPSDAAPAEAGHPAQASDQPPGVEPPPAPPSPTPRSPAEDNDPLLAEMLRSQPWLDPAMEEAELAGEGDLGELGHADMPAADVSGEDDPSTPANHDAAPLVPAPPAPEPRLINGIQGLIEPLSAARQAGARTQSAPPAPPAPTSVAGVTLSDDEARQLRQLLREPPPLLELDYPRDHQRATDGDTGGATGEATDAEVSQAQTLPHTKRRRPWIFWLLGLALLSPFLLDALTPRSLPLGLPTIERPGALGDLAAGDLVRWPGVAEAYAAVRDLPAERDVLIYWAYDPATAGELDNVALPVLRHLLARRARLIVVSPLPQGPATARRLLDQARALGASNSPLASAPRPAVELGYLPGGTATLPLVARDLGGLVAASEGIDAETSPSVSPEIPLGISPALVILLAAEPESVQRWLEQVQPYGGLVDGAPAPPVVAVTSAVVDPVARAYWQSGQLAGLVSGFTGAAGYRRLLDQVDASALAREALRWQRLRLVAQNWGQVALLIVIAAGNAAALLGGRA